MKKVLSNSKLSTPSKLVRRVLSRTSSVSRTSHEENKGSENQNDAAEIIKNQQAPSALEIELTSLREQVSILQLAVNNMQEDAEKREKAFANLAREKQQLFTDLRKERRSTTSLKQQLQDEREFYYKEKEQYCQEMNECKKLKKKISENTVAKKKEVSNEESAEILQLKNQISKLKEMLNQTLEANYNLSVKFLRMKNTKITLKSRLQKQENDHKQAMQNLQRKINGIKNDIMDIVDKRFTLPISPSNKKYLQVIKKNGMLMYENLCLQMEIDSLSAKIEYLKFIQGRREMREKLKLTRSSPQPVASSKKSHSKPVNECNLKSETKSDKQPQKVQQLRNSDKQHAPSVSTPGKEQIDSTYEESNVKVIKIFERDEAPGIPQIIMLPLSGKETDVCPKEIKENTDFPKVSSETPNIPNHNYPTVSQNSSQVCTEASDGTCTTFSHEAVRTQSAPEIVQTSLFVSEYHKP